MLTEQPILITSIKCNEIGGIIKSRFIGFNGLFGQPGIKSLGVVNADTDQNNMTPVVAKGIAIVQAGDVIPLGSPVEGFDDGTAVAQSSGALEGYALDASTAAFQFIRILLA